MAEILGILGSLGGALIGAGSQQEAAMIQLMNLRFQKQQADRANQLATATRTDAYGNQQRYNAALNRWETILTPTQKQIVGAGETEQLKALTTDAVRNRRILEEARQRGIEAIPDYNKALAGFRYDEAPSRAADEDKLNTLLSLQSQSQIGNDRQAVGRTLIRQGKGADYAAVLKAADDAQGQNIGKNLLTSYQASIPQYAQDVAMRQSRYLPVLKQLQETMAGGGSAPPRFSTTPSELNAIQSGQSGQALSALEAGARGVGGAYQGLANSVAATNPVKDLASLISAFNKGGNRNQTKYGLVPTGASSDPGAGFSDSGGGSGDGGSPFYSSGDYTNQYNDLFGGL